MYKFFNLNNYRDSNYTLILIAMVLCFSSFQTILTPSIDYIALNIKNNNHMFYSYATIASLVATIPQASALISGYVVNNLLYRKAISIVFGVIVILSGLILLNHKDFGMYVIFVIISGVLSVALYCNIDRQIVILLKDKIRDFQNDSFIWGSILAIINLKFSNWLFVHYSLSGIISYNLLLNTLAFICLYRIPAVDKIASDDNHHDKLPNLVLLIKTFLNHPKLLIFWGVLLVIMFTSSGFTILLTTKIHHEGIPNSVWSSNMALMAFGNLLGAVLCKTSHIKSFNSIKVICFSEIMYGLSLILLTFTHQVNFIFMLTWFLGFINPFILINMNTLFARYISNNEDLVRISPVVNGALTSGFYIVCLIGPLLINFFLQVNISYVTLFIIIGIMEVLLSITLINIKNLRHLI